MTLSKHTRVLDLWLTGSIKLIDALVEEGVKNQNNSQRKVIKKVKR